MIRDLLNPSSGFLDLREDSKGVIQVAGITEVSTINAQEVRGYPTHECGTLGLIKAIKISSKNCTRVFSDHGVANEGQQAAHAGANSGQSNVISLPRCAPGGREAAEPLSRRPAGGPLRSSLHDRPRWLRTSRTGLCSYWLKLCDSFIYLFYLIKGTFFYYIYSLI